MARQAVQQRGPGRPRKFDGDSKVITLTLPVSTLADLALLDADRAKAIVRAATLAVEATAASAARTVELLSVTEDAAVITVPDLQALSEIDGLKLLRILPHRHLVIFEVGTPLSEVEVALSDKIEALPPDQADDAPLLEELIEHLRVFRRSHRTRTAELILVNM